MTLDLSMRSRPTHVWQMRGLFVKILSSATQSALLMSGVVVHFLLGLAGHPPRSPRRHQLRQQNQSQPNRYL